MPVSGPNPIILYDGVCGLCNRLVQFVLKHDSQDRFRFASLQSDFAAQVLRRHGAAPDDLDTMYVVIDRGLREERITSRSDAGITVLRELGGGWAALGAALRLFPCGCEPGATTSSRGIGTAPSGSTILARSRLKRIAASFLT